MNWSWPTFGTPNAAEQLRARYKNTFAGSVSFSDNTYLLLLTRDDDVIYLNDKDPDLFVSGERPGMYDFPGYVYKLVNKTADGHCWNLFYGVKHDVFDRKRNFRQVSNSIMQALNNMAPGLIDRSRLVESYTMVLFLCWKKRDKFVISNITGNDALVVQNMQLQTGTQAQLGFSTAAIVKTKRAAPDFSSSVYVEDADAYVMLVLFDGKLIYLNDKDSSLFSNNPDSSKMLSGMLYKLIVRQTDGHEWTIFSMVRQEPEWYPGRETPVLIDHTTATLDANLMIDAVTARLFYSSPRLTDESTIDPNISFLRTYHGWKMRGCDIYVLRNTSGSEAYVIHGTKVQHGNGLNLTEMILGSMTQAERVSFMRASSACRNSVYLEPIDAYLMMLVYDDDLIYFNDKDPSLFVFDRRDNTREFPGRLYKIVVNLSDGHSWSIFYGIKTDDPIMLSNMLDYGTTATFVVQAVIGMVSSDFLNPAEVTDSRTDRVYTCREKDGRYMVSNMAGTDAYTIDGFSLKKYLERS